MSQEKDRLENQVPPKTGQESPEPDQNTSADLPEGVLRQACHDIICPDCELLARERDKTLRAMADTENFRKRLTREKEEFCRYAVSSFVEEIIPVLDNLELALEHGRKNKACQDLAQGVEMTLSMFNNVLEKNNLVQVGSIGEEFDPGIHEALAQEERDDMEQGTVCRVLQKGYLLNDRLVRPAKVMVSKKCES